MHDHLNVYVTEVGGASQALAVGLVGEVDLANASVLRGELLRLLNRCQRPIVLDLGELSFIDSAGLRVLIAAYNRAEEMDCPLSVVAPSREVSKVFAITALDTLIPIYPSVADACKEHLAMDTAGTVQPRVPIETFLADRPRVTSTDATAVPDVG